MNQNGFIIPLLIILVTILLLGGGIYVYQLNTPTPKIEISDEPASSTPLSEPERTPSEIIVTATTSPIVITNTPSTPPISKNGSIYLGQKTSESVSPGDKINFSWNFSSAPANSAVVIIIEGPGAGRIAEDLSPSGSYTWTVPPMACTADGKYCSGTSDSAAYSFSTEGTYKVYAELYSPKGGLGGGMLRSSPDLKIISSTSPSTVIISR